MNEMNENKFRLCDELNGIIDQAKFIRNILVYNETAEFIHVAKYIIELREMINRLSNVTKMV